MTALGSYRQANELNEHGTRNRFRSLGDPWEKNQIQEITVDYRRQNKEMEVFVWKSTDHKRSMIRKDSFLYPFFFGSTWQNVVIQKWPLLRLITSYHALGCLFRHFLEEFHQLLRDFHGGARHRPQSCLCKEKYHRAGGYKVLQAKDAKASRKKVGFKGRYFFFQMVG